MSYKIWFTLLIFTVCFSCQSDQKSESAGIIEEVKNLNSNEAKQAYLEQVFSDDQAVRNGEGQEILIQFGQDSEEYRNHTQAQWDQDDLNLKKVEAYINIHGHPDRETLGETASITPWAVIHHSRDYHARDRNFETIYAAFLNDNIDDGALSFYLGRMYRMKFGERLKMESPFTIQDELKTLIEKLDLVQKAETVESKFNSL